MIPVITGVNFHPIHGSGLTRPLLRDGRVRTLVDPVTRPTYRRWLLPVI